MEGSYDPSSTIRVNPSSPGIDDSDVEAADAVDDQPAPAPNAASLFSLPIAGLVEAYKGASTWSPSSDWTYGGGGGGFSGGDGGGSSSHF